MNTIAAISTATGNGGIGIIRMSGENCFEILNKFFRNKEKKVIDNVKGRLPKLIPIKVIIFWYLPSSPAAIRHSSIYFKYELKNKISL